METPLTKDILEAFHNLGGEEFLAENPDLLHKILLRINAGPEMSPALRVLVDVPWLSPGRLSYRYGIPGAEAQVQDVEPRDIPQSAPPSTAAWKEPAQDPEIGAGVSVLKHQLLNPKGN